MGDSRDTESQTRPKPREAIPLAREVGKARHPDDECCKCFWATIIAIVALVVLGSIVGGVYLNGKANLDVFAIDLRTVVNGIFLVILIVTPLFGLFKLFTDPRIHDFVPDVVFGMALILFVVLLVLLVINPIASLTFGYVIVACPGVYYAIRMVMLC